MASKTADYGLYKDRRYTSITVEEVAAASNPGLAAAKEIDDGFLITDAPVLPVVAKAA